MKIRPLFISAPSRSGSSLLTKTLNCTDNIVVVNEPVNSVNIVDKENIIGLYQTIENNLRNGFVMQRVDRNGLEATDTFPPSEIRWDKINRSIEDVEIIGIKKSFPAFSNKDYFKPFIKEWPCFVKWMINKMNGGVIAIVRDPKFTILSWKTTFEALKETTEKQCAAWNLIAKTILSTRKSGVLFVRYEDLILDQAATIKNIADYLGIKTKFKQALPKINQLSPEDYFRIKGFRISDIEREFGIIDKLCGKMAKNLGYD